MRTLLFVQTGDARPKCVRSAIGYAFTIASRRLPEQPKPLSETQARAVSSADRWFLVECANADAGRRVIDYAARGCEVPWHEGRILASGGRQ